MPSHPKYQIEHDMLDTSFNRPVFRIRALRDIPLHRVRAGDLGGYIEGEHNLAHTGSAWIADNAKALDRSRVEGDALLRQNAKLTGHAVLCGDATAEGHSNAGEHAVIRSTARITDSASIGGNVLIAGNVSVGGSTTLYNDHEYHAQHDVPWSFTKSSGAEPDYLDRLRTAVKSDPSFSRTLASFGATTTDQRDELLTRIWNGQPEMRKRLITLAQRVGGQFDGHSYTPLKTADLAVRAGAEIQSSLFSPDVVNFRHLHMASWDAVTLPSTGQNAHAAVVRAVVAREPGAAPKWFYQPAVILDVPSEKPSLAPYHGRVNILPETYEDQWQALRRAEALLAGTDERPEGTPLNLHSLPYVAHTTRNDNSSSSIDVTLQRVRGTELSLAGFARQMTEPDGYLTLRLPDRFFMVGDGRFDLETLAEEPDYAFSSSVENALGMATPIYANRQDFIQRLSADISSMERQAKWQREMLSWAEAGSPQEERARARLAALEPANTPVLAKVVDLPVPGPGTSTEFPAAFRFRHSGGVSYLAGNVALDNGRLFTGQYSKQFPSLDEAIAEAVDLQNRPTVDMDRPGPGPAAIGMSLN